MSEFKLLERLEELNKKLDVLLVRSRERLNMRELVTTTGVSRYKILQWFDNGYIDITNPHSTNGRKAFFTPQDANIIIQFSIASKRY